MKKLFIILPLLVSSLFAQVTGLAGWDLFVDPGHSITQNMGVNGYSEAEETLQTALHLRQLLLSKTDIDTVWSSRYNDNVDVSLYERTDDANSRGATWYHSIHSNAGAPEHNNVLLLWGAWYDGTPDPPVGGEAMSDIMVDLLADAMRIPQSSWGSTGDCPFYSGWTTYCQNNPTRPYLYVNRNTSMPSQLSEQGHHTNPLQNQLDMNNDYTRLMAYSMFWTVLDLFELDRPYPGILTGIISDIESGIRVNGAVVTIGDHSYTTDTYESLFNQYSNDPDELHNGFYFFEDLADTTLEMIITAEGYYPDTLTINGLSDDFATFRDVQLVPNVPPVVIESYPVADDQTFPAWGIPYFDFSREMNTTSVEAAFSISPEADGIFYFTQDHKRMAFLPADTLAFTTAYTITLAGTATDTYGHPLDGNGDGVGGDAFSVNFMTSGRDLTAPVMLSSTPANGAELVDLEPAISLIYNEEIEPATLTEGRIVLERMADLSVLDAEIQHFVVDEQSVVILHALEELNYSEAYRVRIFPGVEDLFGNAVTNGTVINFTAANYEYAATNIDNFESNLASNWWEIQMSGSNAGILTDLVSRGADTDHTMVAVGSNTALRIDYGWDPDASSWLIREYLAPGASGRNVHFSANRTMQAYIFGDGLGNKFRFCVDDNINGAGAHEVSPWFTIDWLGWKLVSWDMANDGTGTWIGDGSLDGTMEFDSIQLSYSAGQPNIGTYFIDELRVVNLSYLNVRGENKELPSEMALLPNYPNPFNPWTQIPFTLSADGEVTVSIYSLKGELITTVLQGHLNGGYHVTRWNASDVSSGMYLVRLESEGQSATRKITLLK